MLFLPVVNKISTLYSKKKTLLLLLLIFIVIESIGLGLYFLGQKGTFLYKITGSYFIKHVSMATIGYFVAKANLFQHFYPHIQKYGKPFIYGALCMCILIYQIKTKTTYVLTPLYVLLMYSLQINLNSHLNKIILFLAKHSMNIWFFHCIFWAPATRNFFQRFAYFPENPVLVVVWVLFICSMLSITITPLQNIINKKLEPFFT